MRDDKLRSELGRLERRLLADPDSIVLAPGSHRSPGYGMCAVEAASLLAGEDFSDRPSCVCPVVAAYVRALNDRLHHADRQRLRPYVGRLAGSRGDRRLRRDRRELLLRWADGAGDGEAVQDAPAAGHRPSPLARLWRRARIALVCGLAAAIRFDEGAGEYTARAATVRGDLDAALALLDEALALGDNASELPPAPLVTPPPGRWPQPDRRSRPSHGRPLHTDHPRTRGPEEPAKQPAPKHLPS